MRSILLWRVPIFYLYIYFFFPPLLLISRLIPNMPCSDYDTSTWFISRGSLQFRFGAVKSNVACY
ncbi:hypothetical protein BDW59DRAFT_59545 [Aspergillus cavernicola]|uniref:Uncharacterized protein n=1 Tax=Aspergillus cavernicola TaxID=176166 RepID=A0ABR4IGY2_9EURO